MNTTAAFAVREASGASEARRAAMLAAERLELSPTNAGRVGLIVAELGTNLLKHAREGEILVRALDHPAQPAGIEILSIDKGPGMRDVAASMRDGHSTAGTLGHGLGAVQRQADLFDIYSTASGTIVLARVWADPDAARERSSTPGLDIGGVLVSMPAEQVCGDDWTWRLRSDRAALFMVDGLGHGLQAHDAARAAIGAFARVGDETPSRAIEDIHAALRQTRGAAIAMMAIDLDRGVAKYSGLGNIVGVVIHPSGARQGLVSMNGTAGHATPRVQEFSYAVPSGAIVVMHSDGLGTQWDLAAYPGLRQQHPSIIAGVLYRDFSRRRDDVAIVVLRERT